MDKSDKFLISTNSQCSSFYYKGLEDGRNEREQSFNVNNLKVKTGYLKANCPICNEEISNYNNQIKYCYNCGVKLKW